MGGKVLLEIVARMAVGFEKGNCGTPTHLTLPGRYDKERTANYPAKTNNPKKAQRPTSLCPGLAPDITMGLFAL